MCGPQRGGMRKVVPVSPPPPPAPPGTMQQTAYIDKRARQPKVKDDTPPILDWDAKSKILLTKLDETSGEKVLGIDRRRAAVPRKRGPDVEGVL